MDEELLSYEREINSFLEQLEFEEYESVNLYTNLQKVTAFLVRAQVILNTLVLQEIHGKSTPQSRKFRTQFVQKNIETLERVAQFESRKITAKDMEYRHSKGL